MPDRAGPAVGHRRRRAALQTAAGGAIAAVFAAPLVVLLLGSLRSPRQPPAQGFELWPAEPRWANYDTVRSFLDWPTYLVNSAMVVAVVVPAVVLTASAAGLLLHLGTPPVRWLVGSACGLGLLVPASALWVPRVVLLRTLGLADHPLSTVAPIAAATTPFGVLLFYLAYRRLPTAWFDVAATEGLSAARTWWTIALPAARGATFAVALITFVYAWSDFIDPLTLIASPRHWPLALGLRALAASEAALYPIYLAAAVLATVPAVALFLVAHRAMFTAVEGEQP